MKRHSQVKEAVMTYCSRCGKEAEVGRHFPRTAVCPHCGRDLHTCLNCRFYSESAHNKCTEPGAEFQRVRDKANFCDYFAFREGPAPDRQAGAAGDAKKRFEALFRKG